MRSPYAFAVVLLVAGCKTLPAGHQELSEVGYGHAILENQRCFDRFDRIERERTVTVINRDRDGNISEHARQELTHDIVREANDLNHPSGLGGVSTHPFFSERDSFYLVEELADVLHVGVDSQDPAVQHYLENIVITIDRSTGQILTLRSNVLIHGYSRDGHSVRSDEVMIQEWQRMRGCDLPVHIRHYWNEAAEHPRLTVRNEYRFVGSRLTDT